MQATLKKVRSGHDSIVFQIQAPAVAAVLTRTLHRVHPCEPEAYSLRYDQVPERTADRFADAFAGKPVAGFEFRRNDDGKWFVEVTLRAKHKREFAKPAAAAAARAAAKACAHQHTSGEVDTMDTTAKGTHRCPQCMGTGRYVTGIENGAPKFGTGICYRCKGKGRTTEIDRRRNLKYWEHAAAKAMGMDIANAEKVAS